MREFTGKHMNQFDMLELILNDHKPSVIQRNTCHRFFFLFKACPKDLNDLPDYDDDDRTLDKYYSNICMHLFAFTSEPPSYVNNSVYFKVVRWR